MPTTQRGQGQAAAQPSMEPVTPLHFSILLCLCLLLLGPCSWLALRVLLLLPISSSIFLISILAATCLVLLSIACLELPQPGAWEDVLELCGAAIRQPWCRCQRPRRQHIIYCSHRDGYVKAAAGKGRQNGQEPKAGEHPPPGTGPAPRGVADGRDTKQ